jgi:hypothetical protein
MAVTVTDRMWTALGCRLVAARTAPRENRGWDGASPSRMKREVTAARTEPRPPVLKRRFFSTCMSCDSIEIIPRFRATFESLGLTAQSLFTDPRVVVWRSITERQNCTLDLAMEDGARVRLHVKRFEAVRGSVSPAEAEALGIRALEDEGIPTAPLVAFGSLADGRSVLITEDLAGFRAADKCIESGLEFERILGATADLAARLHARGLHHRDLYLCHFFVKVEGETDEVACSAQPGPTAKSPLPSPLPEYRARGPNAERPQPGIAPLELRLIDAARVRRLPGFLTRGRWIVKDLAQFWYSTMALAITEDQRTRWLARYAEQRGLGSSDRLRRAIERKCAAIARHDTKLKAAQPTRNVSIPGA